MIMAEGIKEIRVENQRTGEVIARITEEEVDTNSDDIVVVIRQD